MAISIALYKFTRGSTCEPIAFDPCLIHGLSVEIQQRDVQSDNESHRKIHMIKDDGENSGNHPIAVQNTRSILIVLA